MTFTCFETITDENVELILVVEGLVNVNDIHEHLERAIGESIRDVQELLVILLSLESRSDQVETLSQLFLEKFPEVGSRGEGLGIERGIGDVARWLMDGRDERGVWVSAILRAHLTHLTTEIRSEVGE